MTFQAFLVENLLYYLVPMIIVEDEIMYQSFTQPIWSSNSARLLTVTMDLFMEVPMICWEGNQNTTDAKFIRLEKCFCLFGSSTKISRLVANVTTLDYYPRTRELYPMRLVQENKCVIIAVRVLYFLVD